MIAILAAAYILFFVLLAAWFARREGYLSAFVIFGITGFYYYIALPLELWLRGESVVRCGVIWYTAHPDDQLKIMALGLTALLGFAFGLQVSGFRLLEDEAAVRTWKIRFPRFLFVLGIFPVVIILAVYGTVFHQGLGDYSEGNAIRYNNPLLAGMMDYAVLALVISASLLAQGTRRQFFRGAAIAGLVVLWGMYTVDKNPICLACLSLMSRYLGQRSRRPLMLLCLCGGAFLVVAGLPLFSAYRAAVDLDVSRFGTAFSVLDTDAAGPAASLTISLNETDGHWRCGTTYLLILPMLIPRVVWPDRPPDLSEQFALDNMDNWFAGGGFGYSLMTEAYVNFGILGGAVQYFLIALVLGRVWMWLQVRFRGQHRAFWRALYVCSGLFCIVIMHRGPTNQIARYLVYNMLPVIALYWIFDARCRLSAGWARRLRSRSVPTGDVSSRAFHLEKGCG